MNTLFDMEICNNQAKEQIHAGTGHKCRACVKRVRLVYRSGQAFSYCGVKPCGRTCLGIKKIKANDPACSRFEKKQQAERAVETRQFNTVYVNWCGKERADA